MGQQSIRVLVVDDYPTWRDFASATVHEQPDWHVVGEVSDGLEAVRQAIQLQPDLILMDIGLPKLTGIQAAKRIQAASPGSRILFTSENRSPEIVQEAMSNAEGYVLKSDAVNDLLAAAKAVLEGKRFISQSLADLVIA